MLMCSQIPGHPYVIRNKVTKESKCTYLVQLYMRVNLSKGFLTSVK